MTKRLLSLFTALTLLLSMAVPAYAVDGPCITAQTVTAPQGSTACVEITVQQFSAVGSVDLTVYYDADALTVTDTNNGWMIDGNSSFLSVNTDIAGQINVSAVTMDAFYNSGTLLYIYFDVPMDCTAKSYPLAVTVGNAYGNDLLPMSISAVDGKLAVTERSLEQRQFYLYGWPDKTYVQQGDTFTLPLQNNWYYSGYHMASGDFTVKYDPDLFRVDSVELSDAMKAGDAIWSVNTDIAGTVLISYAASSNVASYTLMDVHFTVIGNADTSSAITYSSSNVYDQELLAYLPSSGSFTMYLSKAEEVINHPDLWLEMPRLVAGQQATSTLMLQKGAGVAAGDFVVTYDPTVLRCVSVTAATGLSASGGMVVIDDNFTDGTIEFPYINSEGYDEVDIPLVQIVWEPLCSSVIHSVVTPSGSMVYDAQFQPVTLEFVPRSDCIFVRTVIPPVCLEDGCTNYACACGESFDEDIVPQLGHDIQSIPAKAPTCTEIGWEAHEGCTRCDYGTRVDIPALGHDEIPHNAQEVSCTEIGWEAYVTCSRCDYTTYEEIPALGHRTIASSLVLTDPLSIDLETGSTPFTLEGGVYYSNNHTDGSSSEFYITALYDCSLQLICGASSEQNFDKLIILKNGSHMNEFSGFVTGQEVSLSLSAGDVVTVQYSKDGSVYNGEDRGWVELQYEYVTVEGLGDVPSEELTPDCVDPVVCSYCNTVVKETLPHDYEAGFTWNTDHSACEATLICKDCTHETTVVCNVSEDLSDPEVTIHTANITHENQTFTDTLRCDNHLIVFQNWDGSELSRDYCHPDRAITAPPAPIKAADETYTYTFAGWDQELVCTGDMTITATFAPVYIDYTVTFKNWDGAVLSEETYHYGNAVQPPADPAKEADKTYTYTFAGWDTELICTGDMTITATYIPVYIDYTVVFQNWDGAELARQTYHYGDTVTPPADPEKLADETYTYVFAGWDQHIIPVAGDAVYTAAYTPVYIDYTVTFLNSDGSTLSQKTYHYGDAVEIPPEPQKPADIPADYVFKGWDQEVSSCAGDTTYTAVYGPPYPRGDMNSDFQVSDADALYLLRHTLFPQRYPLQQSGDVNGDGEVSDADALYLLRYTLFPQRYPLH